MKTREECIITYKGTIKKKIYCILKSGIEIPIKEYKILKRKKINIENYYIRQEAKRLLNE